MKVVINRCYGGFGLSKEAYEFLGIEWDGYGYKFNGEDKRTNPKLVECVETLGGKADGFLAALKVVEIPDDVDWYIREYDGYETIEEVHHSWS
jgi:hypothetical protein